MQLTITLNHPPTSASLVLESTEADASPQTVPLAIDGEN